MNEQALKERLKYISKESNLHFNLCWKKFLLERFLARVSKSPHRNQFIFKGGFLLSYFLKMGRETKDLDFLITKIKSERSNLENVISDITTIPLKDGFAFKFINTEPLDQPHMEYSGFRMNLSAELGKMRDKIQIDIGTGDKVTPKLKNLPLIHYKGRPIFEGKIPLMTYPIETIFAEKLETVISKGPANSRMKDYHDLLLMIRQNEVDLEKVNHSIRTTFNHRGTPISTISFNGIENENLNRLWKFHLKNLGDISIELNLPTSITTVIDEINRFLS